MELIFRKHGNSTGLTFPAAFLREHDLTEGQVMTLETQDDGTLLLRPKAARTRRYTAAELNAQCNFEAPMPADLEEWEHAPAIGSEHL